MHSSRAFHQDIKCYYPVGSGVLRTEFFLYAYLLSQAAYSHEDLNPANAALSSICYAQTLYDFAFAGKVQAMKDYDVLFLPQKTAK